ncbi:hypothetical protein SASPL_123501 [Salvia splendens]|uniref:Uncharacterized protein n=1 Tax=Salvia splendens TaxID=180675 RepID=A0A8X8XNP0_SALSN|nr:hypothetical protein SASPL_123501 [Salvia splendens]
MQATMKHPFAVAYYYYDEPEYNKICCFFGIDDVKEDSHTDLISIPSSSDADSSEDSGYYEDAPDNDEVNSPAVFSKPTVCRKLFDDDVEATDRESTTAKGIYWIDVGPYGTCAQGRRRVRHCPTISSSRVTARALHR